MRHLYVLLISFLCLSCASSYRQINPLRVAYAEAASSPGMEMEYKYGVLRGAGNKKYARKADDKHIKIVAMEFTNKTTDEIEFARDIEILADNETITPLSPEVVKKEVKQVSGLYMLWSLLWLTFTKCENDDCSITPIPIGFLIGLGNTIGASSANKNFHRELEFHDMMRKRIAPGETVKGLLILRLEQEQELYVRLK